MSDELNERLARLPRQPGPGGDPLYVTHVENYRIDHYYSLEADGHLEEGHIFCTPDEGELIAAKLREGLPDVNVHVDPGGEYDYTTEETPAETIADDILNDSGFVS